MPRAVKVNLSLILLLSFAASLFATPKNEYFTEDELDLIRDAQELTQRVPVYFKLAERRLIFLGLMEKSEKEKEKERKEKEKREKEKKKAGDTRATANKVDPDDTSYLADFTSAELLRGYIEALDEITSNIDTLTAANLMFVILWKTWKNSRLKRSRFWRSSSRRTILNG